MGNCSLCLSFFYILGVFGDDTETEEDNLDNIKFFNNDISVLELNQSITNNEDNDNQSSENVELTRNQFKIPPKITTPVLPQKDYDLEMSLPEIVEEFIELTEIQRNEKFKEFKGKRIKTSIYVSEVNKASLSSQYVVHQLYDYPYNLISYAKAFFPSEQKDDLLRINTGEKLVFIGEFVSFKEGHLTTTIEFTKSKVIGVEKK